MNNLQANIIVSATDRASAIFGRVGGKAALLRRELDGMSRTSLLMSRGLGALGLSGAAVAAGFGIAFKDFAAFDDAMRDFGNTIGAQGDELDRYGDRIRDLAPAVLQSQDALLQAAKTLAGRGLDGRVAIDALEAVGRAATATGADVNDMALAGFAAIDNLKFPVSRLASAFDMMNQAGKEGGFELKDMARWLPELSAQFVALGRTGPDALAELGAAAEIALKNAGSTDQAANNLSNFLSKLTSRETTKNLKQFGIDTKKVMKDAAKNGTSYFEEMIDEIVKAGGDDPFKLAKMFPDKQAADFLRAMIQNRREYERIRTAIRTGEGSIERDFRNRANSAAGALKKLSTEWQRTKTAVGELVAPGVVAVLSGLNSALDETPGRLDALATQWAEASERLRRDFAWLGNVADGIQSVNNALGITWYDPDNSKQAMVLRKMAERRKAEAFAVSPAGRRQAMRDELRARHGLPGLEGEADRLGHLPGTGDYLKRTVEGALGRAYSGYFADLEAELAALRRAEASFDQHGGIGRAGPDSGAAAPVPRDKPRWIRELEKKGRKAEAVPVPRAKPWDNARFPEVVPVPRDKPWRTAAAEDDISPLMAKTMAKWAENHGARDNRPVKAELEGQATVKVSVQVDGGRITGMAATSQGDIRVQAGVDRTGERGWHPNRGQL